MKDKKICIYKTPDFFEISKNKLIKGILIWLFVSFIGYAYLYFIRELFRLTSVTEYYDLWILSDNEVSFYNLFSAYLSVITALSVCFSFWFDAPKKIFAKKQYKRISIVHEQRFLNACFLSWFPKFWIIIIFWYGVTIPNQFWTVNLYSDCKHLFILIIIVLFLNLWTTIRLTLKRQSFKLMIASALILSVFAFGLSKINLTDYQKINNMYLQKNVYYNYNIELPESAIYNRVDRIDNKIDIYIAKSKDNESVIIVNNKIVSLSEISNIVAECRNNLSKNDFFFLLFQLHISKMVELKFVKQLETELSKAYVLNIAYSVVPIKKEYDVRFYKNFIYPMRLPQFGMYDTNKFKKELKKIENVIDVSCIELDKYKINNCICDVNDLKDNMKKLIEQNLNYVVKFHIEDNVFFCQYISALAYIKMAVLELRNEYSETMFFDELNSLSYEIRDQILEKYPLRIYETNDYAIKQINHITYY